MGHTSDKKKHRDKEKSRRRQSESKEPRERSRSRERRRERSRSREKGRERSRERKRNRSLSTERRSSKKERNRSKERHVSQQQQEYAAEYGRSDRKKAYDYEEGESEDGHFRKGKRNTSKAEVEPDRSYSPVEVKASSSGDASSLSIEETNKLRISLGLKPLQVESSANEEDEDLTIEQKSRKDPILFPVKNIGEEKEAEKLRSKMATMKETRKILKTLSSVKTLGEAQEDEDASSWVDKMRRKDEENKRTEEMVSQMDDEFGVSSLVSQVMSSKKAPVPAPQQEYSSQHLQGIRVEHDTSVFKDGSDVTLIIKDSDVLDESEPVLLNLNLLESDKASKNVELKKGKSTYNPYEKEEVDEFGNVIQTSVLNKYDEEIHGEKKKYFKLGDGGVMDTAAEKERELVRQRLQERSITLSMGPAQLASEYYSTEEMVAFKKPKKKKKLRKKEKVKADDLLPLDSTDNKKDHGSRRRHYDDDDDMEIETMDTTVQTTTADVDLKDEKDSSVAVALQRTRRLLQKTASTIESTGAARVANMLQNVQKETFEVSDSGQAIILDETSEFCKHVGGEEEEDFKEMVRRKSSTMDHSEDQFDEEEMEVIDDAEDDDEGGWKEVREHTKKKEAPKVDDLYQEAEPLVAAGVISALQLASKKGFVDSNPKAKKPENVEVVTSVGRRDIEYERQKERERDRELSRYGRDSAFPEKKDYIPNVNIEYVDESGRLMNTKEAFRFMSHKFHGRTSGRKKMDKRLKKLQEEKLLSSASSTDTPLNTLSVLQSKQKAAQSPYVLISGGAQSLLAPDIAKRK